MAHYPKPFFRATRGVWYVQINGQQINLGPDKDAAFKSYHGLMQKHSEPAKTALAMAFKLAEKAQSSWRKLNDSTKLQDRIDGIVFVDGERNAA